MQRSPIRKVSTKQKAELALRQKVHAKLLAQSNGLCPDCGKPLNHAWPGGQMHHLIPLSLGGETSNKNCILLCTSCHSVETNHVDLKGEA